MVLRRWFDQAAQRTASNRKGAIAGAPNAWGLTVARDEWRQAAEDMAAHGGRLLSLWASRDGAGDREQQIHVDVFRGLSHRSGVRYRRRATLGGVPSAMCGESSSQPSQPSSVRADA